MKLTWLGTLYLALVALGALNKVWEIGKPRKPVTSVEATITLLVTGLITWGIYTIGVTR